MLEFDAIAAKAYPQEAFETVKPLLKTLLASVMTLSAVHCVDPAIADRSVDIPELEKPTKPAKPTPENGPKLEL